ncbi:hypothetical protein MRB53_037872 [Persea americana]|nr:hypothetical protein MRB53_037872 [Persea americana]
MTSSFLHCLHPMIAKVRIAIALPMPFRSWLSRYSRRNSREILSLKHDLEAICRLSTTLLKRSYEQHFGSCIAYCYDVNYSAMQGAISKHGHQSRQLSAVIGPCADPEDQAMAGFGSFGFLPAEIRIMIWHLCGESDAFLETSASLRRDAMVHIYSTRRVSFTVGHDMLPWDDFKSAWRAPIKFHNGAYNAQGRPKYFPVHPSWLTFDSPIGWQMRHILEIPLQACRTVGVWIFQSYPQLCFPRLYSAVVWLSSFCNVVGPSKHLVIDWTSRHDEFHLGYESEKERGVDYDFRSEDEYLGNLFYKQTVPFPPFDPISMNRNVDAVIIFKLFRRLRSIESVDLIFEESDENDGELMLGDVCEEVKDFAESEIPFGTHPHDHAIKHEEWLWSTYLETFIDQDCCSLVARRWYNNGRPCESARERFAYWTDGYERGAQLRLDGLQLADGSRPDWHAEAVRRHNLRRMAVHAYNPRGRWFAHLPKPRVWWLPDEDIESEADRWATTKAEVRAESNFISVGEGEAKDGCEHDLPQGPETWDWCEWMMYVGPESSTDPLLDGPTFWRDMRRCGILSFDAQLDRPWRSLPEPTWDPMICR